ncbi:hypothetical protein [Desertivirga brevis]|uniref:hypothetical protein n=1 Tax=Desertivirga brevis TaxID=2810310 RepID=UPI001A9632CD|nr:hypothetical protein [Pedobacter sp. SYSU D00873]
MKTFYSIFCSILLFYQMKGHAQQKQKPIFNVPREGSHSVPNTSREDIFEYFTGRIDPKSGQRMKPEGNIIAIDTVKGILKIQYKFQCDDSDHNNYIVTYNIRNNFFSFKISDFTNSDGKQGMVPCQESATLSRRDKIIANSLTLQAINGLSRMKRR